MENLQPKLRFPEFKDDWIFTNLNEMSLKIKDGTHFSPKTSSIGQFKYITSKNVKNGYLDFSNLEFVDEESHKSIYKSCDVKYGDILLTKDGTIGQCCVNDLNEEFSLLSSVAFIRLKENYSNYFIYQLIVSSRGQREIEKVIAGQALKRITLTKIKAFNFNIPTLQEQTKIADFLGAVDKQLDILNQKKEKLNTYKKGVMQQLFAQQLRFKDDNGNNYPDWQEKTLGEIGNSFNGLTGKTAKDFGEGKKYIQYKQIFDKPYIDFNDCGFVNIIENEKQNECKIGDVFFTVSSETKEEIAMSSVIESSVDFPVYLNSFCFGIRFKENVLIPKFSRFYFRNEIFRKSVIVLAQGSTRFNLSKVNFMKLAITIPSIEEQTKIANFLSAIDKQIEAVENQITKTETYKKGLLQQMFV